MKRCYVCHKRINEDWEHWSFGNNVHTCPVCQTKVDMIAKQIESGTQKWN